MKKLKYIYITLVVINIVFAVVAIAEQSTRNNLSSKAEIVRNGPLDIADSVSDDSDTLGVYKRVSRAVPSTTPPITVTNTTNNTTSKPPTQTIVNGCTNKAKIANLDKSINGSIKKLAEHQDVCGSFVSDRLMLFTSMADTTANAQSLADDLIYSLDEYAKYGLTPIVIAEPVAPGGIIDPVKYKNGNYDVATDAYFARLKNRGVTDQKLGIWVPFPETNIPEWNNRAYSPDEYVGSMNRYAKTLKKYFPSAKVSVLLDSQTYTPQDSGWNNGKFQNLVPFVTGIQPGLVDMIGLQGFPWKHPANQSGTDSLNPQEFLNSNYVTDAAAKIGVNEVWFNTGTFSAQYTRNGSQTVYVDSTGRQTILNNILLQMQNAQKAGFKVWVTIFAENKSKVDEAINWSYWTLPTDNVADKTVYLNFVKSLTKLNIGYAIYDSK